MEWLGAAESPGLRLRQSLGLCERTPVDLVLPLCELQANTANFSYSAWSFTNVNLLIASRNNLRFNSACYAKGRKPLLRKNTSHLAFLSMCLIACCVWLGIYLIYGWWTERGNLEGWMKAPVKVSSYTHVREQPAPHPTPNFRRLFQDTGRGGGGRSLPTLLPGSCSFFLGGKQALRMREVQGSEPLCLSVCSARRDSASQGEDPFGHRLLCQGIIAWEGKELSSTNDSFVVGSYSEQHREPPPALSAFSSFKGTGDDFYSSLR